MQKLLPLIFAWSSPAAHLQIEFVKNARFTSQPEASTHVRTVYVCRIFTLNFLRFDACVHMLWALQASNQIFSNHKMDDITNALVWLLCAVFYDFVFYFLVHYLFIDWSHVGGKYAMAIRDGCLMTCEIGNHWKSKNRYIIGILHRISRISFTHWPNNWIIELTKYSQVHSVISS